MIAFINSDQPPGAEPISSTKLFFCSVLVLIKISSNLKTARDRKPSFFAFKAHESACINFTDAALFQFQDQWFQKV